MSRLGKGKGNGGTSNAANDTPLSDLPIHQFLRDFDEDMPKIYFSKVPGSEDSDDDEHFAKVVLSEGKDAEDVKGDSGEIQEFEPQYHFEIAPFICLCCNAAWKTSDDLFNHLYKRYPPSRFVFDKNAVTFNERFDKMFAAIQLQIKSSFVSRTFDNNNRKALKIPLDSKIIKYIFKPGFKMFLNQSSRKILWNGTNWKEEMIPLESPTNRFTIYFLMPHHCFDDHMYHYEIMEEQTDAKKKLKLQKQLALRRSYKQYEKLRTGKAKQKRNNTLKHDFKRPENIELFLEEFTERLAAYVKAVESTPLGDEDGIEGDVTDEDRHSFLENFERLRLTCIELVETNEMKKEEVDYEYITEKVDLTRKDVATFFINYQEEYSAYVESLKNVSNNVKKNIKVQQFHFKFRDRVTALDRVEAYGTNEATLQTKDKNTSKNVKQDGTKKQDTFKFGNIARMVAEVAAGQGSSNQDKTEKSESEDDEYSRCYDYDTMDECDPDGEMTPFFANFGNKLAAHWKTGGKKDDKGKDKEVKIEDDVKEEDQRRKLEDILFIKKLFSVPIQPEEVEEPLKEEDNTLAHLETDATVQKTETMPENKTEEKFNVKESKEKNEKCKNLLKIVEELGIGGAHPIAYLIISLYDNGTPLYDIEEVSDSEEDEDEEDGKDTEDSEEIQEVASGFIFNVPDFVCRCCKAKWRTFDDLFNHIYKAYPPPDFTFDTMPIINNRLFGKMYDHILDQMESSYVVKTFCNNKSKGLSMPLNAKGINWFLRPDIKLFLNYEPSEMPWEGTDWQLISLPIKNSSGIDVVSLFLPEESYMYYAEAYELMESQINPEFKLDMQKRLTTWKNYENYEKKRIENARKKDEEGNIVKKEISVSEAATFIEIYKRRMANYEEFLRDEFVGEDNMDQFIATDEHRTRFLANPEAHLAALEEVVKELEGEEYVEQKRMARADKRKKDLTTFFDCLEMEEDQKEEYKEIKNDKARQKDIPKPDLASTLSTFDIFSAALRENQKYKEIRKRAKQANNRKKDARTQKEGAGILDKNLAAQKTVKNKNGGKDKDLKQNNKREKDGTTKQEMKSFFASMEANLPGDRDALSDEEDKNLDKKQLKKQLKKQAARKRKAANRAENKRRQAAEERNVETETEENVKEEIQQEKKDIQDEHVREDDNVAEVRTEDVQEEIPQEKEEGNQDKQVEEDDAEEEWKPYFDSSDMNLDAHWGALEDADAVEEEKDNLEEQVNTEDDVKEEVQQEQVENVQDDVTQRFPYNQKLKVVFAEDLQKEGYVYDFLGGVTAADYQKSLQTIETRSERKEEDKCNVKEAKVENVS